MYADFTIIRSNFRPAVAGLAGFWLFSASLLTSCSPDPGTRSASEPGSAVPVRLFTVAEQVVKRRIQAVGSLNVQYNVRLPSTLGGEQFYPIRVILRGPELNRLAELSKQVAARMEQFPGLVDVNPMINLDTPELQVHVDRQRAADLGVRMTDIASTVRLFYSGEDEISTYKEGSEQYPVTMMLLPGQRDNPEVMSRLMVPSSFSASSRRTASSRWTTQTACALRAGPCVKPFSKPIKSACAPS